MAALFAHRLRRAVVLTPSLRHFSSISAAPVQRFSVFNPSSTSTLSSNTSSPKPNPPVHHHFRSERAFRSTAATLFSQRGSYNDRNHNDDQIDPDAILFEGCDYNHWLITMEFPKDSKPSPEEMVETYVQTAAKVLGSVEEAKKKIYACSTTTYQGFQVEVSEEMSEKFKGLPGVVFILPDSYIDPVNKEYGGDKYINGTIIPRPPPVQYGRQGGRYNDRNRDYNRPPRGINNASAGQNNFQGDRGGPMPDYQRNHNQGEQRNYYPPRQTDFQPREQRNYSHPPQGGDFGPRGDNGNYSPPQGGNFGPGGGNGNYSPPQGGNFGPGGGGDYNQGTGGNYRQGTSGNYGQGVGGNYGQGGGANYRQGVGGNYGQGGDGNYGQGAGGNYGQGGGRNFDHVSGTGNYSHGGGRNYREGTIVDHGQGLGQQGNYEDIQNAGTTQGRY